MHTRIHSEWQFANFHFMCTMTSHTSALCRTNIFSFQKCNLAKGAYKSRTNSNTTDKFEIEKKNIRNGEIVNCPTMCNTHNDSHTASLTICDTIIHFNKTRIQTLYVDEMQYFWVWDWKSSYITTISSPSIKLNKS